MTCSPHNFGVVTSVDMLKSADFLSGMRWAVRGFCDKVWTFGGAEKRKAHHEDEPYEKIILMEENYFCSLPTSTMSPVLNSMVSQSGCTVIFRIQCLTRVSSNSVSSEL